MKLISYCNQPDHPGLEMYRTSCEKFGWQPIFLGEDGTEFSWEIRLRAVRDFVDGQPPGEVVLFTDCFDVLLLGRPEQIETAFRALNAPLVISAERGCWPMESLAERFRPTETSFRFPCAGTYVGRAEAISQMMADMGVDYLHHCADQMELSLWFIEQARGAILDTKCAIFQCYYGAEELVVVREKKLKNLETGSEPLILHANGRHDDRKTGMLFRQLF